MKFVFQFLLSLLLIVPANAQNGVKNYEPIAEELIQTLREECGLNKEYPAEYEMQFLLALSHFPELKEVHIILKNSAENTTMACRPQVSSLFKNTRTYYILINNRENFDGILLSDVPFNAQVGVIGHEIAHVLDYEQKSVKGIIATGIGYLFEGYKRELEHRIDTMTAERGLGWQLYDWATYAMYDSDATQQYKDFKKRIYMSPEQIVSLPVMAVDLF